MLLNGCFSQNFNSAGGAAGYIGQENPARKMCSSTIIIQRDPGWMYRIPPTDSNLPLHT